MLICSVAANNGSSESTSCLDKRTASYNGCKAKAMAEEVKKALARVFVRGLWCFFRQLSQRLGASAPVLQIISR